MTDTVKPADTPMSDGYYLEAMEQLNEKFKEIEYIKSKIMSQNESLKKEIMTLYGLIRVLDNMITDSYEFPNEIVCLSEIIRGHASTVYDDII